MSDIESMFTLFGCFAGSAALWLGIDTFVIRRWRSKHVPFVVSVHTEVVSTREEAEEMEDVALTAAEARSVAFHTSVENFMAKLHEHDEAVKRRVVEEERRQRWLS